jgi:hypothetical protein
MAKRPIYIPQRCGKLLVKTEYIEFKWYPGMAVVQKQKSIKSLHAAAVQENICKAPLEISTKSEVELGSMLSAFNLIVTTQKYKNTFSVESAYQSSKVFENGGPFKDLLYATSREAKKDSRLRESGHLVGFNFFDENWSLEPRTAFYDWIYINALHKNEWAIDKLKNFDAFTDIEFNPDKSVNCQAYSVALYRALELRGLIKEAISDRDTYLQIVNTGAINNASENTDIQPRLI